ncbi:piwi-like protein Ago3 [Nasonia vitripennis]|uniref:Uncharacterized protein n=1 Tax=Nasonia vitripennis TaxID=7425 RepID=A0A7M7HAU3_NASVI|nr:piwi-like protein Ago3 [Nasonia vitripennis]XP_008216915.1 piwi-like protein Ago3 [Nasonia vitripennis]
MAGRGAGRGNFLEVIRKKMEEEKRLREEQERERQMQEMQQKQLEKLKQEAAVVLQPSATTGVGRGRGSLLEKLRSKMTPGVDTSTPTPPTTASVTSVQTTSTLTTGRGALLSAMKIRSEFAADSSSPLPSTTVSVTSIQTTSTSTTGRGSFLGTLKKKTESDALETSGEQTGVIGKLSSLSLEETKSSLTEEEIVSRQGSSGKTISLTANYINLKVNKDKGMFQYEVKFAPDVDSRSLRYKLLNQHLNDLGNVKTFDGTVLYLPIKLPNNRQTYESVHPLDNSIVTLTVIFQKKQAMTQNIAFFNNLMNRVMKALTLVKIGRHDFNPTCAHQIPQHRLEVWPGYVTAINELEGGLKLNLDATHRVMRLDTVRDLMTDMYHKNPNNFKNAVANEIIGTSVLTRYNNRTYKIDDIDWDKNPMLKFERKDEEISLFDYYKHHYNITIQDLKQPLLVHRSKEKKTTGETVEKVSLLIPELCFLAGITDSIRSDFRITKDLSQVTKVSPEQRRQVIRKFIQQVNGNEVTKKLLADWGLEIDNDTLDLTGRVLDPEELVFGNDYKTKSPNADWGKVATNSKVLRTPNMPDWAVLCTQKNQRNCNDFVETLKGVCQKVNIRIGDPRLIFLKDDSTETYVSELRKVVKNRLNMVVIIFPALRQDKYSAVKKICCVETPVPSQVIISRTIAKPEKLKSVTEKIALQINCKLGGALWALKNPFTNAMVCGIDVFHAGVGQGSKGSVAAFIASLDKMLTSWHSRVCLQAPHQELVDLLSQCLVSAINVYREKNGQYPDRIFIYRDGVGDGQLETVKNYEVRQFLNTCARLDPAYKPKLSVIIVQKRVNTRIFEKKRQLGNPPPGTVVDSTITRRFLYDFYLVPQLVRQGTVTPTHYIVLHDGGDVKTDHMQRFTYKLCHLYYNWPGTIRVPAPCQYAHKLAYLVGQSIKSEPSHELNNLLYYL